AQCLPFVSCPSILSQVTSFVACGGGQSMSATPAAVNLSAGAQCLPFVSCPSVLSTVTSFVACGGGQSMSAQPSGANQTGSMSLSDLKQRLRQAIEYIETLEKTNGTNS
ncbi:hypothetical protein ABE255_09485, partial [Brevibacillus formosus]|uniref:hypothetical protein n=1 Tax=Brevibacillus formosus TaxID=54913 RepID=UPI003D1C4839